MLYIVHYYTSDYVAEECINVNSYMCVHLNCVYVCIYTMYIRVYDILWHNLIEEQKVKNGGWFIEICEIQVKS